MKKVILNENQMKKAIDNIVEENIIKENIDDFEYEARKLKLNINYYKVKYEGIDIDWISDIEIDLYFKIEINFRRFGIEGLFIHSFRGPSEIDLEVELETEEPRKEYVTIPMNWQNDDFIHKEKMDDITYIGIERAELYLKNDEKGKIVVDNLVLYVNEL